MNVLLQGVDDLDPTKRRQPIHVVIAAANRDDANCAITPAPFAAPLVAGAIARLLQTYPTMTVPDVWAKLLALSAQHVGVPDLDRSATVNQRMLYMSPFE